MSNEAKDDPNTMTIAEAIRLKHELGQSITWGNSGLNALQIEEMTKLTAEDYAQIRELYKGRSTLIPTYGLVALMAGCAAAYFFLNYGWVKLVAVIIGVTCITTVFRREGDAKGYIEGYEAGHDTGIYKVLGIKPEELSEMRQFATDMKIDNMLVGKMNERENGSHD
jgi:hypothetical protein